jgi:hypothetical protein
MSIVPFQKTMRKVELLAVFELLNWTLEKAQGKPRRNA